MATIPGALLIGISSPYARRGLLWQKHQAHWGKAGNVLVIKAPTWLMNPTVPRDGETIAEAYDADPEWAAAEYGAEFRSDLESLLRWRSCRPASRWASASGHPTAATDILPFAIHRAARRTA